MGHGAGGVSPSNQGTAGTTKVTLLGPLPYGGTYTSTTDDPTITRLVEAGWTVGRTWQVTTIGIGTVVTYRTTGATGTVTDGPWGALNPYDVAGPWVEVEYHDTLERIMTRVAEVVR